MNQLINEHSIKITLICFINKTINTLLIWNKISTCTL